ncbi:MBL fold metallo-hydrolase [Bacteroidota bacterium]
MNPEVRIKFYGTRGSIPVSDPDFQEFGGNTTCISIKGNLENRIGILDAGTGIRKLGKEILSPDNPLECNEIIILFSHFHWDHILGFPFFNPAYDPDRIITIMAMGENLPVKDLRDIFDVAMQSEYFPVNLDDMNAKIDFLMPGKDMENIWDTKITSYKHNHPGGAYSYRFERNDKVWTICTDIEHGETIDQNVVELAKGADLLIHDGQFTAEELKRKKGWGHSSCDQAISVAEQAGCKQLIITHHDPDHDDQFLRDMEIKCKDILPNCEFAREGMEIVI